MFGMIQLLLCIFLCVMKCLETSPTKGLMYIINSYLHVSDGRSKFGLLFDLFYVVQITKC